MTGPGDPVGGPANDDDGEDVEAHVGEGRTAPTGPTLEADEVDDIEEQVSRIQSANQGREPGEQVSVAPEDVS